MRAHTRRDESQLIRFALIEYTPLGAPNKSKKNEKETDEEEEEVGNNKSNEDVDVVGRKRKR